MIVLFTDFGLSGPYVGQVTAVLRQTAPETDVIPLFSDAPAHNPKASAYLLAAYVDEFPPGTVFLCVVDPGVGSTRAGGILQSGDKWFVAPDNGLLSILARRSFGPQKWYELPPAPGGASPTFHGRDVFAPVAGRLARGELPPCTEKPLGTMLRAEWPDDLAETIYIDGFGNAMTCMRASRVFSDATLRVGDRELHRARTFSDVSPGTAFWYENSNGLVEIAVNAGRADEIMDLRVGLPVKIS
jgi:S-adenosylmethionine hydrolase